MQDMHKSFEDQTKKNTAINTLVTQTFQIVFSQNQQKVIKEALKVYLLFYKQNLSMNCFQWIFTKKKKIKKCSDLSPNYLKQETGRIADCARNEIKDILSNTRFIRASIDELENAPKQKKKKTDL